MTAVEMTMAPDHDEPGIIGWEICFYDAQQEQISLYARNDNLEYRGLASRNTALFHRLEYCSITLRSP